GGPRRCTSSDSRRRSTGTATRPVAQACCSVCAGSCHDLRRQPASSESDGSSAPVGHACTHSPHPTHVDSPIGSSKSKTIFAELPRFAYPITSLTWTSRHARTQRVHWL